jgi:hypothetical protein
MNAVNDETNRYRSRQPARQTYAPRQQRQGEPAIDPRRSYVRTLPLRAKRQWQAMPFRPSIGTNMPSTTSG